MLDHESLIGTHFLGEIVGTTRVHGKRQLFQLCLAGVDHEHRAVWVRSRRSIPGEVHFRTHGSRLFAQDSAQP
jgi:hypothetical protein